ncbi:MAG TPA: OmpA family protein, partial [Bacteroidales bacterium]|nr:OmpA family protein [Bacteroidales bacterium]
QNLISFLKKNPTVSIEISGHTDNKGSVEHNKILSRNRAKTVYDYLIANGIDYNRLTYKGYGFDKPIADNSNEAGRKLNRRTEFKITGL